MKTLTIIIFAFMLSVILYFYIREYMKSRAIHENLYNMNYLWLGDAIYRLAVTKENYDELLRHFEKLNQLVYKNREKTNVLFMEFLERFKSVAL